MMLWFYLSNIAVGFWNLGRATAGVYRPNGHSYFVAWWYCVDCLCNAVAGGDPEETISSRAGKARTNGRKWACWLCTFLGWIATLFAGTPTDHCGESIEASEGSRAIIPDGD